MLYKKYPYEGNTENNLYQNIKSNKIKKFIEDEELNDLLIKMLKEDINERISWEDYFNHSFFNKNDFPLFNFKCKNHSIEFNYYCVDCKLNICDLCLDKHLSHEFIPFFQIGLNDLELNKYEILLKNIEENVNKLNKMKEEIKSFINKIKLCKNNINIYENDKENNIIICEFDIDKDKLNKPIQILNYLNEEKKNLIENIFKEQGIDCKLETNEDEINELCCDLYLNDKKIDFCYEYKFIKEGKYKLKIIFKKLLKNTSSMFRLCSSLTSLNLSNFNTNNINNMSLMFGGCSSLSSLNLSNFNTNNVKDMSGMFGECSSLTSLNLSNFNTNNVTKMEGMFDGINKSCCLICNDDKIRNQINN